MSTDLKQNETPEILLTLAAAYVTQQSQGHIKTDWSVRNKDNKTLIEFPKTYTEAEMFKIMDFVKEYELEAFNTGIKLGKEKTVVVYDKRIAELMDIIKEMKSENERLASILDKHFGENEAN